MRDFLGRPSHQPQLFIKGITDEVDHIDVLFLAIRSDIEPMPGGTLIKDSKQCPTVIFHENPIANVSAIAIDGKGHPFSCVGDHERNQLFRELKGAIIVRAVGDEGRETIGAKVGMDHVIRGGFAGSIRARREIGGFFREIARFPQGTVDLVCGNMKEPLWSHTFRGQTKTCGRSQED